MTGNKRETYAHLDNIGVQAELAIHGYIINGKNIDTFKIYKNYNT